MKYENLGYSENFDIHPLERIIFKYVKKGPVLDIGCGNGNLLAPLKNKFDVEGFDISKIAVNLARKKGLNVKLASIDDFKTEKKFKTILMIGFLVLSKNPKRDLNVASNWLDKDGIIILTVPNLSSPKNFYRFFKKNKHHFYFPSYFGFRRFLKKNGFKILACVDTGKLKFLPILNSVNLYIIKPIKNKIYD